MKVILTERVKSLGQIGETVKVNPGFARNYLIPNSMAVVADEANKKQADHVKRVLSRKMADQVEHAKQQAKKVNGITVEIIKRVGASGKLFGSVTAGELSKVLEEKGIDIEKRVLVIDKPIKSLGSFSVKAKIFPEVQAVFTVEVKADPEQLEELRKKQEELAAQKALLAAKEAEAATAAADGTATESQEMSEEEKLKAEANKILRS